MIKCVVPGCLSINQNIYLSFFRFPNVKSKWPKALTEKRFGLWCHVLGFRVTFNPKNNYVCNLHFVSGAAATLFDVSNVDWVPSLNLPQLSANSSAQTTIQSYNESVLNSGYTSDDSINEYRVSSTQKAGILSPIGHSTSLAVSELTTKTGTKRPTPHDDSMLISEQEDNDASEAKPNPKRLTLDNEPAPVADDKSVPVTEHMDNDESVTRPEAEPMNQVDELAVDVDDGISDQQEENDDSRTICDRACRNCQMMNHYRKELQRQFERINYLSTELNKSRKGISWLQDDAKCKRYTGISSFAVLKHIFEYVKPYMFEPSCELTKDEVFLMTFRKLRKNTSFVELADDYSICVNTASKYFYRTVKVIHDCLQYALTLPSKENSIRHTPQAFKRYYGNRRVLVMDCFEVRTERPGLPKAANAHHSAYKMAYTTKFLIVMAADGSVAFISNAYVGRCSDRFITVSSGFLDLIEPDDVILADKGFNIADLIASKGAILNIPTFLRKSTQMNPIDIERDRQITSLRVHVERIIGQIKKKYNILNGTIEVNSLRRFENNYNSVDLIVRLACILISFNKSIVYH